jgi:hypothetical protein
MTNCYVYYMLYWPYRFNFQKNEKGFDVSMIENEVSDLSILRG